MRCFLLLIMGFVLTIARAEDSSADRDAWLITEPYELDSKIVDYLHSNNQHSDQFFKQNSQLEQVLIEEMQASQVAKPKDNCHETSYTQHILRYCKEGMRSTLDIKEGAQANWQNVYRSAERGYSHLASSKITPDGRFLIFSVDSKGDRNYTIKAVDLKTFKSEDILSQTNGQVYFTGKNAAFYYIQKKSATSLNNQVRLYEPLTQKDKQIFVSQLKHHELNIYQTTSKKYLVINESGITDAQAWTIDLSAKDAKPQLFQAHEKGVEYYIGHIGELFYIRSNRDQQFKLYTASQAGDWQVISPEGVQVEDYIVLKNNLVLLTREKGVNQIQVRDEKGAWHMPITFPDANYTLSLIANNSQENNRFRYRYSSLTTPNSEIEWDIDSQSAAIIKQDKIQGYDADLYQSDYQLYPSKDGTLVPVTLVYKKSLFQKGKNPLLTYAYGAYGSNMEARFSHYRTSLLDRGFVYAIIHTRGGGELGSQWHDSGRGLQKKKTFEDFIAVTEGLLKSGYGQPQRVYAMGESAGGLIMGVVANTKPELFRAIVAQRPFLDVLIEEDSVGEAEEWGNPNNAQEKSYMGEYSPYANIKAQNYPAMLITTARYDSQVPFWNPMRYVEKVRRMHSGSAPILADIRMDGGHAYGASKQGEIARAYAFILIVDKQYTQSVR